MYHEHNMRTFELLVNNKYTRLGMARVNYIVLTYARGEQSRVLYTQMCILLCLCFKCDKKYKGILICVYS